MRLPNPEFSKLAPRLLLIAYFGGVLVLLAALGLHWHFTGRAPEQPIPFSHAIHAGRLGLPCTFCHQYVDRSPQAGIPSLETCLSCHRNVAVDRPSIRKLRDHFERGEPVVWKRVHTLPDFVYFTHERHVKAGLECGACHGQIASMEVVRRVRPLQMGWCVSCHWSRGVSRDCATCHI